MLTHQDNTNFSYDLLLKFPFETDANITNGGISHLCCNNSLCYASSSKNCSSSEKGFLCLKINSTIYGLSYGGKCGGTIGNALIATNSTIGGRCITKNVSLSSIADYIATEPTNNFFGLDVGYAYYDCIGTASNVPCNPDFKYCNWDNGGWTCYHTNFVNISDACFLQWNASWPGIASLNPLTTNSSINGSSIPPSESTSPNSSGIPIQTWIEIGAGGVAGIVVISGVVYCYRKKIGKWVKIKFLTSQNDRRIDIREILKRMSFTDEKPILGKIIGRGGYGEVYKGKWVNQDVAVKKLYLSPNNVSKSDIETIIKEVETLKKLQNRHIIQYYGVYSGDQEILIIMDYAENGTLTKFINDNKDKEHDWNINTELIKQMALGLAYVHQQNVIHRDLKSLNILLTKDYEVKISDFGLAKTKNGTHYNKRVKSDGYFSSDFLTYFLKFTQAQKLGVF